MKQRSLLLIGHGSRDEAAVTEYYTFAEALEEKLAVPVQACFLEFADPAIVDGIRTLVEVQKAEKVIALPLFLGPAGHQKNDVPTIINWAKQNYSETEFTYGAPIGAHYGIVQTMAKRIQQAIQLSAHAVADEETAILVVGRGSRDPDSNSEVYKVSRLLWEGRSYGWVETCFYALTKPDIAVGIERCVRLGAKRVIVLPYLLFTGLILQRTEAQVHELVKSYPDIEIIIGGHLGVHDAVLDAAAQRYQEALDGDAAMSCDLCKYRHKFAGFENEFGMPQTSDHHHGLRGVHDHGHSHSHSHDYD